jgi:hypothetical protein
MCGERYYMKPHVSWNDTETSWDPCAGVWRGYVLCSTAGTIAAYAFDAYTLEIAYGTIYVNKVEYQYGYERE